MSISFFTFDITNQQINTIIKLMKNTCPGNSGINKIVNTLIGRSNNTKKKRKKIYNALLTAGNFPDQFKQATTKFMPKSEKNSR